MTSMDRADLVPEAARVLRDQGHPDMASILDNTTDGARKVRGCVGSVRGPVSRRGYGGGCGRGQFPFSIVASIAQ